MEWRQTKKDLLEMKVVKEIVAQLHLAAMVVEQLFFKHCNYSYV